MQRYIRFLLYIETDMFSEALYTDNMTTWYFIRVSVLNPT